MFVSDDSIEAILEDATMHPKEYCRKHDCGQGIYDELEDYVPDMCIHLVGRTEAVMRRSLLRHERREVAGRLCADADHGVLPYFDFLGAVAYDIGCRRDARAVLRRLADLMDPEGGEGHGG